MDVLISAARDVASVCKLQLPRSSQMSTEDFLKLSDVISKVYKVTSRLCSIAEKSTETDDFVEKAARSVEMSVTIMLCNLTIRGYSPQEKVTAKAKKIKEQ